MLKDEIEKRANALKDELANGAAKDNLYEYGRRCGEIRGLKSAVLAIETVHKRMAGEEVSIAAKMARK